MVEVSQLWPTWLISMGDNTEVWWYSPISNGILTHWPLGEVMINYKHYFQMYFMMDAKNISTQKCTMDVGACVFTYWGLNKMNEILQAIFAVELCESEFSYFHLNLWSLFALEWRSNWWLVNFVAKPLPKPMLTTFHGITWQCLLRWSGLGQVTVPSHYLNQCWQIISETRWYSY